MIQAVAGLGNPGAEYEGTRHNVGFEVLDELARRHELRFKRGWRLAGHFCMMRASDRPVVLVRPQTFMNRSGDCVAAVVRKYRLDEGSVLVVVDDVDLPLGQIRIRPAGGAGGHNGLRSVIDRLGSQAFPRMRLGVGLRPPGSELVDFVLGRFTREERVPAQVMVERAADAVETALEMGVPEAMNRFNGG